MLLEHIANNIDSEDQRLINYLGKAMVNLLQSEHATTWEHKEYGATTRIEVNNALAMVKAADAVLSRTVLISGMEGTNQKILYGIS